MQKTSRANGLIYKRREDGMLPESQEALEEVLTKDQILAIGEALSEIRHESMEYAKFKFNQLMREVGQLRAELQLMTNVQKLIREELKKDEE